MPSLREFRRQAYNAAAETPHNTIMALLLFCLLIAVSTIAGLQRPYIPALKPPTHPFPAIQVRSETTSAGSINMGVFNGVASTGTTSSSMVMIDIHTFDPVLPTGSDLARLTTASGNDNFDVTSIGMTGTGGTTTIPTIMAPTGVPALFPTVTSADGAPFPFLNISTLRAPTHTVTISQASTASINCANPANAYEVFYCALQHTSATSTSLVQRAPTTMLTVPSVDRRAAISSSMNVITTMANAGPTASATNPGLTCNPGSTEPLSVVMCIRKYPLALNDMVYTNHTLVSQLRKLPSVTHSIAGRDPLATTSDSVPSITSAEPSITSSATLPTRCTPGPDACSLMACMESSLSAMLSKALHTPASATSIHG
nr:hypothetical protein B0A51_02347 [Rachicladosporium sp. CCFEE 5018]